MVSKLNREDKNFLELLLRSTDRGDGWRNLSQSAWKYFTKSFKSKELVEINESEHRVRLNERGKIVVEYM